MERAIQSQLVSFLTKTIPYQYINQDSGRNLPPKLPLYIFVDHILEQMDKQRITRSIFIDLKKALLFISLTTIVCCIK